MKKYSFVVGTRFSELMVLYGVEAGVAVIISLLMYLVKVAVGVIGYGVYVRQ